MNLTLELRATADELDALAYALAGARFPGLGPTLVSAAERGRDVVAGRLLGSLVVRGIVVHDDDGPAVAPRYWELLHTALAPDLAVLAHVRTPDSSTTGIACLRGHAVTSHVAEPAGIHALRPHDDLVGAIVELLDAPRFEPGSPESAPSTRVRYSDLMVERADSTAFTAALADWTYAAKLTRLGHRDGTYAASTAVLVAGTDGPLWTALVEPDGYGDGWVHPRQIRPADVPAWVRAVIGNPSHSMTGSKGRDSIREVPDGDERVR